MASSDHKSRARERFRGFENLLVPSFTRDLRTLDEEGIRLDVRQSIRHGFFATRCALEAGLRLDEKKRMLSIAADEAGGRIGVSLSLSGTPDECRELLAHAESVGATHVALGYPQDFRAGTQRELVEYVRGIAAATGLAVSLTAGDRFACHHLHPSGVALEALEELAEVDNIVALELASADAGLILECCERFAGRLLVATPQLGMLPLLSQSCGVQWGGAWAVEGLQSPEKPHAVGFLDLLLRGRVQEAMRVYWTLAPALGAQARVAASYAHTGAQHWPLVKYQQWLSGGNGGMTRQPVMRLYERDMLAIRGGLRAVGVECADPDAEFFAGRTARRGGA